MQYIATKNQNKKADNHPDFRLYMKDANGEIIQEEYTKQDGTKGKAWKSFGAMWFKIENGKIKSASISIDDPKPIEQKAEEVFDNATEDVNVEDFSF